MYLGVNFNINNSRILKNAITLYKEKNKRSAGIRKINLGGLCLIVK